MADLRNFNLIGLIQQDVNLICKPGDEDREIHGPCPFCGGKDRFIIFPTPQEGNRRYWCRQCNATGDALDYIQRRDNIGFTEACAKLELTPSDTPRRRAEPRKRTQRPTLRATKAKDYAAFDPAWQQGADDFCLAATMHLWEDGDPTGLDYLLARGISPATAAVYELGHNPTRFVSRWGETPVTMPPGIVIPWKVDGDLWRVNVRQLAPDAKPKYIQAAGGANGLFNAHRILPGNTVVMVEGEFDAMLLDQELRRAGHHEVIPVALGTVAWGRLNKWISLLARRAGRVLIALDTDEAGAAAAAWWGAALGSKARRLLPTAHDVTDMWRAGEDLAQWATAAVPLEAAA